MGRRKLTIKRIEDIHRRHAAFSKRRSGLMKKARELSILCDVDVLVFVFSGRGKLYQFCSDNNRLHYIINKFKSHIEGKAKIDKGEHGNSKSCAELVRLVEMLLKNSNGEKLSVEDCEKSENLLNGALANITARKNQLVLDSVKALENEEMKLKKENGLLLREVEAMNNSIHVAEGLTNQLHLHSLSDQHTTLQLLR